MTAWITFIVTFLISLGLIPLVRRFSHGIGKISAPRDDRWHQRPTATLGGIGIFMAFAISLAGLLLISLFISPAGSGEVRAIPQGNLLYRWGLLIGASLAFSLGVVDDFLRISPPAKLIGQILAATVVIALGYTTQFFTPRLSNPLIAQILNILLTYLWLVGITNAINLLDNMDGLAGGISFIAAGILSYFFWRGGNLNLLLLSMALAGSLLGFLVYNFPPASIFMGDSGSMFLGFTLAVLAISRQPQASNIFAILGVPTLLFLLPILDTTLVTFTRLLRGQPPTQGGRDHTSHRLIAFGLSERQAVVVLYVIALASGIAAIGIELLGYQFSLIFVPLLVLALALITVYLGKLKVVSSAAVIRENRFVRLMLELTYRRRVLEVLLDFFIIVITFYLSFIIKYGLVIDNIQLAIFLKYLPLALATSFTAFYLLGVYRSVWRYTGLAEWIRYAQAAIIAVVLIWIIKSVAQKLLPDISDFVLAIFMLLLFLSLTASRSSFRIMDRLSDLRSQSNAERILIVGAGDAGEMALRWIQMNPQLKVYPVGFIDRDRWMQGRRIHNIPVLGGYDQLPAIIARHRIQGLILADPVAGLSNDEVYPLNTQPACWVKRLRLEFDLLEESNDHLNPKSQ